MNSETTKLWLDFLYRTWLGIVAVIASFVWRMLSVGCMATAVFWPVFGVLVVAFVGTAWYTIWTMAKAAAVSQEEYQDVGGGAVVVVLLLLSVWFGLFCEGG